MHAGHGITDRFCGVLQGDDIREHIGALSGSITSQPLAPASGDKAAIAAQIHTPLAQLEEA